MGMFVFKIMVCDFPVGVVLFWFSLRHMDFRVRMRFAVPYVLLGNTFQSWEMFSLACT